MSAILRSSEPRVEISSDSGKLPPLAVSCMKWRRSLMMTGPFVVADLLAVCATLTLVNAAMLLAGKGDSAFQAADVLSLCLAVILAQAVFGLYQAGPYVPVVDLRSMTTGISLVFLSSLLVGAA